jgi:predicted anti-sigma-YlaC factor YlaD
VVLLLGSGCSVRRLAVNQVANALTSGSSSFATDNDPELVKDALPFSLKLMESLLSESPRHQGLLLTLGSGFTQYGYAFVQMEAERLEDTDLDAARQGQVRARNLYLRGRNHLWQGWEVRHPGFVEALFHDPQAAVSQATEEDVPWLYWTAASWAAAISLSKDDPSMVGDLPKVEALIDRALVLDEDWNRGSLHQFLITFEMSRATGTGDPVLRATRHFERALALSEGKLAGPRVAYAEAVCIPQEDRAGFVAQLEKVLALDVNADPSSRVENLVLQRRARWLMGRVDELFLPPLP